MNLLFRFPFLLSFFLIAKKFLDNSHNATSIDEKKRTVKFSKILRSGNWVIVDLASPCLVSDININFQSANNAISGILTVDTWMERESDGSRLVFM